jgi:hypothetical protein
VAVIEWVKEHPYETAGGVFVVGLAAIIMLNLGGGSASSTAATDPNAAIDAAQLQAEMAAQQQSTQLQATQEAAQLQLDQSQLSAGVANTQVADQLTAALAQTSAAQDINAQNDSTSVQNTSTEVGGTVADTTTLANAQLGTALGADSATVSIAQANATTNQLIALYNSQAVEAEANDIAKAASAQSSSSMISSAIGLVGSLL